MHVQRVTDAIQRWRGGALLLMGFMLPVFFGFVALSVDTAVLCVAESQLQSIADASALAGATSLAGQQVSTGATTITPTQNQANLTAAQNQAIRLGQLNKVLGTSAVLLSNSSNSTSGDVVVGYLARPLDQTQALPGSMQTSATAAPYFNTTLVTASRNATHTGQVPAFFSRLMGNKGTDLKVTSAAAVLYLSGFSSTSSGGSSVNANLLPITLDVSTYAAMMQKTTTDQYTFTPGNYTYPLASGASNGVSSGGDGLHESQLYPVANGYPGNWGTIQVGVTNNSTATLVSQIQYGITAAQLATYPGGVIQPDPTTGTIQFQGNPGISSGIKAALTSIIGKPVFIPIFDPNQTGGTGTNLTYTVVAFAPVRILAVNFQGKNKYVIIQPATVPDDTTQVWGGISSGPLTNQYRIVLIR